MAPGPLRRQRHEGGRSPLGFLEVILDVAFASCVPLRPALAWKTPTSRWTQLSPPRAFHENPQHRITLALMPQLSSRAHGGDPPHTLSARGNSSVPQSHLSFPSLGFLTCNKSQLEEIQSATWPKVTWPPSLSSTGEFADKCSRSFQQHGHSTKGWHLRAAQITRTSLSSIGHLAKSWVGGETHHSHTRLGKQDQRLERHACPSVPRLWPAMSPALP